MKDNSYEYITKAIKLIFERPFEPAFTPRDKGKAIFDLPDSFFTEHFYDIGSEIQARYSNDVEIKIPIRDIEKPNLDPVTRGHTTFCLFNPRDKQRAAYLIKLLMDAKDAETFVALAIYIKDRVNVYLFQYAYAIAVQHRKDTSHVPVPPVYQQFPNKFIEPKTLGDARNEATLVPNPGNRVPLETPLNYTASNREEEQRMAYFREDIGVNLHHWHWHLVYPTDGPREVVAKDRRGELFYYMHHQLLARYNADRFCNFLGATKPLSNLRAPLKEGYFPKLMNTVSNRTYASRMPDMIIRDINRTEISVEVSDLERWMSRIQDGIDLGYVMDPDGNRIQLDETRGIDILYNIIESSALSINRRLYGDLHNLGHFMLAAIHDPDSRFLENLSVMGGVSTAMRDPIFYRWHVCIDNLGNKHKAMLPPYQAAQLSFDGVSIATFQVRARGKESKPNVLNTFWQKSDIDLGYGMDFVGPSANSFVRFTHLQHEPFDYTIIVNNGSATERQGTCRIFIVPKFDERSVDLTMDEKRLLAIEMDKFIVNLKAGQNRIMRKCELSTVTLPFEDTFRRIDVQQSSTDPNALATSRFCGCGWPQHMLLPKGTPDGLLFDLFVMISDYRDDQVVQTNNAPDVCDDASAFCGLKDKLFPDKRSMGFPFDRILPAANFAELVSAFNNMKTVDVKIVFNNVFGNETGMHL